MRNERLQEFFQREGVENGMRVDSEKWAAAMVKCREAEIVDLECMGFNPEQISRYNEITNIIKKTANKP